MRASLTVVRNWVDIPAEALPFPPPPRRIGFVGRLCHEKAPDIFCDVAHRFTGDGHEWHVFGDVAMNSKPEPLPTSRFTAW
jgi:glycosyltransferase involved in cell wall biosynthesis